VLPMVVLDLQRLQETMLPSFIPPPKHLKKDFNKLFGLMPVIMNTLKKQAR
jgi:hypothetical protein